MGDLTRRPRSGRKRGPARGVAVFGSPSVAADDSLRTAVALGGHERLSEWMKGAGLDLVVSATGLRTVDAMIDGWLDDQIIAPSLTNEVGIFLGDVMLHEISDARWHLWPNGHPVIRLGNGRELDVTAVTRTRIRKDRPHLNAILDNAVGAAGPASTELPDAGTGTKVE